jgi:hypothetical protein
VNSYTEVITIDLHTNFEWKTYSKIYMNVDRKKLRVYIDQS